MSKGIRPPTQAEFDAMVNATDPFLPRVVPGKMTTAKCKQAIVDWCNNQRMVVNHKLLRRTEKSTVDGITCRTIQTDCTVFRVLTTHNDTVLDAIEMD